MAHKTNKYGNLSNTSLHSVCVCVCKGEGDRWRKEGAEDDRLHADASVCVLPFPPLCFPSSLRSLFGRDESAPCTALQQPQGGHTRSMPISLYQDLSVHPSTFSSSSSSSKHIPPSLPLLPFVSLVSLSPPATLPFYLQEHLRQKKLENISNKKTK